MKPAVIMAMDADTKYLYDRIFIHNTIQYNIIQYNTMENLHSKTDKQTVSLI